MDIEELEKIVLVGLYEFRIDGGFKGITSFFNDQNMITRHQSKLIFNHLDEKGLVKGRANSSGYIAEITSKGIKYVEENYLTARANQKTQSSLKIKDKYNIILKALYQEKSLKYFDVIDLMKPYENISLDEATDLGDTLKFKGYVKTSFSKTNAAVAITYVGREYVEEYLLNNETYNPIDKFSESEKEQVLIKLDELLDRIKKIELGQEIIHDSFENEFNELKVLVNVLGKKDWKQLLCGKLVDAGLGSITGKVLEALIDVYKDGKLLS